jgi:hypothetical protein
MRPQFKVKLCVIREMVNISRGPTYGDFVTFRTEGSMQDNTVARLHTEYTLPSPPLLKVVLHESLYVDSQNIPCSTLTRRRSWIISVLDQHFEKIIKVP